jgi:hypothetical protein
MPLEGPVLIRSSFFLLRMLEGFFRPPVRERLTSYVTQLRFVSREFPNGPADCLDSEMQYTVPATRMIASVRSWQKNVFFQASIAFLLFPVSQHTARFRP